LLVELQEQRPVLLLSRNMRIHDKSARFDADLALIFSWQSSRPTSPHPVCLQCCSSRNATSYTKAYRRIQT